MKMDPTRRPRERLRHEKQPVLKRFPSLGTCVLAWHVTDGE